MDASRWFEREFNHRNGRKGPARCWTSLNTGNFRSVFDWKNRTADFRCALNAFIGFIDSANPVILQEG